jgi:hypothetical protein
MAKDTKEKPQEKKPDDVKTQTKSSCGCGCIPPIKTK